MDLGEVVRPIIAKYQMTSIKNRWEEATTFGAQTKALAYWIRDSEDVVNIVWLNSDGIRDITWFPSLEQSIFNFLPLRSIASFEVREGKDLARLYGFPVAGGLLIRVFCLAPLGNLTWVADTEKQAQDLHAFARQVFTAYANVMSK